MEYDITILDTIVMPKSNAYSESNVSLRTLANNHDFSRIRKFAKKMIQVETPETHYMYSKELWDEHVKIKDAKVKADLINLSLVHFALSNSKTEFWG